MVSAAEGNVAPALKMAEEDFRNKNGLKAACIYQQNEFAFKKEYVRL